MEELGDLELRALIRRGKDPASFSPVSVNGLFVGRSTLEVARPGDRGVAGTPEHEGEFRSGGGVALNAAVAFSALTGERPVFETRLGGDTGAEVIADLERHGVRVVNHPGVGRTPIFTPGEPGEGPTARVSRETVHPGGSVVMFNPSNLDVLVVDGHNDDVAESAVRGARSSGVPVVAGIDTPDDTTRGLIRYADVVVVSSSFRPYGTDTTLDVLDWLRDSGARYAAVTDGPEPILFTDPFGAVYPFDVYPTEAVDTYGAGGVFLGAAAAYVAFSHHHGQRFNFGSCLDYAAMIAAHAVRTRGTRQWIRDIER